MHYKSNKLYYEWSFFIAHPQDPHHGQSPFPAPDKHSLYPYDHTQVRWPKWWPPDWNVLQNGVWTRQGLHGQPELHQAFALEKPKEF